MSSLVLVVPLKEDSHDKARALLDKGPPFDLEATEFDRHTVYLTTREAVFVFYSAGPSATLRLSGEDIGLWKVAAVWQKLVAGRPRKAETAYSWSRGGEAEGVTFAELPGPGNSEGGDVFAP